MSLARGCLRVLFVYDVIHSIFNLVGELFLLGGLSAAGEELDSAIAYSIAAKEVRHQANLPGARKGAARPSPSAPFPYWIRCTGSSFDAMTLSSDLKGTLNFRISANEPLLLSFECF